MLIIRGESRASKTIPEIYGEFLMSSEKEMFLSSEEI
jgi:hypothetical protein